MVTKLTIPRCYRCRMHVELCFCADLIPQHTATQILILMQWGERHCVTNTAHLLPKCLSNSEIRYRGNPDRSPVQIEDLLTRPNTFVLFPSPSAIVLDEKFKNALTSPATLVALDGNWGQASSMMRREEVFQKLPKVILAPGPKSEYHLRRNQIPGNVCTFEAVARAMGQLESPELQMRLESVFHKMVSRSLWMRGLIRRDQMV